MTAKHGLSYLHSPLGMLLLLTCWFIQPISLACAEETPPERDPIEVGRELFEHDWKLQDQLSPKGDGVGPLYNARSCAACHHQGGSGGGGDLSHNVDVLALTNRRAASSWSLSEEDQFLRSMLSSNYGFVLHKFGTHDKYDAWRHILVGKEKSKMLPIALDSNQHYVPVRFRKSRGGDFVTIGKLNFQKIQRSTPALFGADLIDFISPHTLKRIAAEQEMKYPNIHGVVSKATDLELKIDPRKEQYEWGHFQWARAGKFGWRGQTATLEEFVLGACANELGLQTAELDQPESPVMRGYTNPGVDIDQEQLAAMVAFVRSLPAPSALQPGTKEEAASWRRGEASFSSMQCAACHVPDVGLVKGIYGDLLLHDMGKGLSEPLGTNFVAQLRTHDSSSIKTTGIKTPEQEWRTPPLWGVRDSAPYLHDGRAATLRDAILAHGGEGAESKQRFTQATAQEQADLIAFLGSVGAPTSPGAAPKRKSPTDEEPPKYSGILEVAGE